MLHMTVNGIAQTHLLLSYGSFKSFDWWRRKVGLKKKKLVVNSLSQFCFSSNYDSLGGITLKL